MKSGKLAALRLRQRDGITCGPTVAVVAGAILDSGYRAGLLGPGGDAWFAGEQGRVHAAVNRIWPRRLGTTPAGMARALTDHSVKRGATYRWRRFRGAGDPLSDVCGAVAGGWPVPMLIGQNGIPRHWVLIIDAGERALQCYEPSSGNVLPIDVAAVRGARLTGLGFPRPFAFVVPDQVG
ncbi:hypothetical protein M2272_002041 [Mycobacterium frederiksbergense]|uniref:Peptidase C39 domain-containing protein n=1 Tax=Mycolicibacterium frederiksbergense TaxID=117567 RepID=A0ABT6KXF4_9MYCO|nr:hypothetical protein [Mycolicibacterium frederiksbergense]MDH6195401.1 hypothetical protein [Mycolicibacterium frederiksbergense]